MSSLAAETTQASLNDDIKHAVEKEDSDRLPSLLQDELKKHSALDTLTVTDRTGQVLSRSTNSSKRGDNLFQNSIFGRTVAQGKSVVAFDRGSISPLVLVAAQPIIKGDVMTGSVFTSRTLNDSYVTQFRDHYLHPYVDLAFFSKQQGIVATTFADNESQILNSYVNAGTASLKNGLRSQKVKLGGNYYFVDTYDFPGITESPGGIIVFSRYTATHQGVIVTTITAALFILLALLLHQRVPGEQSSRRYYRYLTITSLLVIAVSYSVHWLVLTSGTINLEKFGQALYNSTLRLEPATAVFSKDDKQTVSIKLKSGGEPINAVKTVVTFDREQLRIEDILVGQSFCPQELFIEKSIDNEKGVVTIACGVANPGFSDDDGIVAQLIVQPLQEGDAALRFGEETQVLANDGLGTSVLRSATNASYQIINFTSPNPNDSSVSLESSSPISTKPILYSPSHPNSEEWYAQRAVSLTWEEQPGAEYLYLLDTNPESSPVDGTVTKENKVTVAIPKDGTYYIHLAARRGASLGPITHRKLLIDSTAPVNPGIEASATHIAAGGLIRFKFKSSDKESGLQNGYYLKVDDSPFLPVAPTLSMPFSASGQHTLTLRAFDKANNYADTSLIITVEDNSTLSRVTQFLDRLLTPIYRWIQ